MPEEREEQVKYFERSLHKLERLLADQNEFQSYLLSGSSHLDHDYFLRSEQNYVSTPGEILISEVTAYQQLASYIKEEMKAMG